MIIENNSFYLTAFLTKLTKKKDKQANKGSYKPCPCSSEISDIFVYFSKKFAEGRFFLLGKRKITKKKKKKKKKKTGLKQTKALTHLPEDKHVSDAAGL